MSRRPLIGITPDVVNGQCTLSEHYARAVWLAGGEPTVLPCVVDLADDFVARCNGIVLSGGDDPIMEQWGVPTHPKANKVDPIGQAFELAILDALDCVPEKPVLGICLGMQYMALRAGARLDQHLPDTLASHATHWGKVVHEVDGKLGRGAVLSNHRQAVVAARRSAPDSAAPGLHIVANAPDGVIEAIRRVDRPFYLGVQWHPERTECDRFGIDLFRELVACSERVGAGA